MLRLAVLAALAVCVHAQGLFAPWANIVFGQPTSSNQSSAITSCPFGTASPIAPVMQRVLAGSVNLTRAAIS